MSYFLRRDVIHPEDNDEIKYWTKKWGVNVRQINDAILETGSVKLSDLKMILRKKEKLNLLLNFKHLFFKTRV